MEHIMEIDDDHRLDFRFLYSFLDKDDTEVIKWCMRMKLLTDKFKCPKCGKDMKLGMRNDCVDKCVWRCRTVGDNPHFVKRSVRSFSWFSDSRLNILNILLISYLWVKKAAADYVKDELNITHQTVSEWFYNCQQLCLEICKHESEVLGGVGTTVEIHITAFKSVKNLRYKGVNGKWLFIGLEKSTNKYFFQLNNCRSKEVLIKTIKDWILPGTIIILDYNFSVDKTFMLLKKTHNLTFKPIEKSSSSEDSLFTCVKQSIRGSCSKNVFVLHLAEYLWRQSHNDIRSLVRSFFTSISKIYPPQDSEHAE